MARVHDKVLELVVATSNAEEIVEECNALIAEHQLTFSELFNNLELHRRIIGYYSNIFYVFIGFQKR